MSSRVREVEHTSASQCEYETKTAYVTKSRDGAWQEPADPPTDAAAAAAALVASVCLRDGTTLRVAPMDRKCGGWDYEHFHDRLRLPEGCNAGRGLVITFEGKAGGNSYTVDRGDHKMYLDLPRSAARLDSVFSYCFVTNNNSTKK